MEGPQEHQGDKAPGMHVWLIRKPLASRASARASVMSSAVWVTLAKSHPLSVPCTLITLMGITPGSYLMRGWTEETQEDLSWTLDRWTLQWAQL